LFQRASIAPLTYMSLPLSATISPCVCMPRKMFWM
jgi:hypothetical protein